MTARWAGKLLTDLTDKLLSMAEDDVGNCLLRAYDAPDVPHDPKYRDYFDKMSVLANAIAAEKERRANP